MKLYVTSKYLKMNISKYKRNLESYGINEKKFQEVKDQLSKKFKKEASDNDVLWSLFNQVLAESQSDFHFGIRGR